jgi:hypothetical protein
MCMMQVKIIRITKKKTEDLVEEKESKYEP